MTSSACRSMSASATTSVRHAPLGVVERAAAVAVAKIARLPKVARNGRAVIAGETVIVTANPRAAVIVEIGPFRSRKA